MKKIFIVMTGAMFLLISCKKDYTCTCTVSGQEVSSTTINDTKSKAKDQCDEGDATIFGFTSDCEIK